MSDLDILLFDACYNGDIHEAIALLDRGADIHARDKNQLTPLHMACII